MIHYTHLALTYALTLALGIKNWRHTIGMTLSHYQKLFQNGYHIFQNTGKRHHPKRFSPKNITQGIGV